MSKKILIVIGILVVIVLFAGCLHRFRPEPATTTTTTTTTLTTKTVPTTTLSQTTTTTMPAKTKDLSQVRVASLYERVTDGKVINRGLEDVAEIFKETKTDFIFRAFWRLRPCPDTCDQFPSSMTQQCEEYGYSYEHLKNANQQIKEKNPEIIICGAIGAQYVWRSELDPDSNQAIDYPRTWDMALDPGKWGIDLTKEEFQCRFAKRLWWIDPKENMDCSDYDPQKQDRYFPDITNQEYGELLLGLAKKQIDSGADAIWIDLLYAQVNYLNEMTGDPYNPAVRDSYLAVSKLVDDIHEYGQSKGKYVFVGTWRSSIMYPYQQPDLDFVTVSPTYEEIESMELDDARWDNEIQEIREKLGDITIFAFIDWAMMDSTPMATFSQKLTPAEQREFLEAADEFFQKKGVIFIYPVHGGYMGENARVLSFGRLGDYDSLALEFQTYETIKELAQNKSRG